MNSLANVTNKPPMASDERFNNASNKSLAKNDNSPGWYTVTRLPFYSRDYLMNFIV